MGSVLKALGALFWSTARAASRLLLFNWFWRSRYGNSVVNVLQMEFPPEKILCSMWNSVLLSTWVSLLCIKSIHALPLKPQCWGLIKMLQGVFMIKDNAPEMQMCRKSKPRTHRIYFAELNVCVTLAFCSRGMHLIAKFEFQYL